MTHQGAQDRRVVEHPVHPVAAQEVDVTGLGVEGRDVELDVFASPERSREHVLGELGQTLFAHVRVLLAGFVAKRVIAGQHFHHVLADPVAATVADVAEIQLGGAERHVRGDHRGVHLVMLLTAGGDGEDILVGLANGGAEATRRRGEREVEQRPVLVGPGRLLGGLEEVDHRQHGQAAGHLPRVAAPDAVGDGVQPEVGADQQVVLVVLTSPTGVGTAAYTHRGCRGC